jgi:oryzin
MVSYFAKLAALAAVIAPIFAAPAHIKIRNTDAKDVIEGSYIVVYNEDITAAMMSSHFASISSILSKRDGHGIGATYNMKKFKGYQIQADEASIAEIANKPEVWLSGRMRSLS